MVSKVFLKLKQEVLTGNKTFSLSRPALHSGVWLQLPVNLLASNGKAAARLPSASSHRVFHPANPPGGPPVNSLRPKHGILDAAS